MEPTADAEVRKPESAGLHRGEHGVPALNRLTKVLMSTSLVLLTVAPDLGAPRAQGDETAEEVYYNHISGPIVQTKCVNCHVQGGLSAHTRLVFVSRSAEVDYESLNLQAFQDFLAEVDDEGGGGYILLKIQGALGHGGLEQVQPGSADFANMRRFLSLLGEELAPPPSLTVETLFDTVMMASPRKTLRRAALIFAGRIPTDEEYAAVEAGDEWVLRATIRGLMEGPQFHEFLIRASNDRLLTDRDIDALVTDDVFFVDFVNEIYRLRAAAHASGNERDWNKVADFYNTVDYGARRAPLELIAHVVENDLPYTEILTADYIMANPMAAFAYGASTQFDDSENPYEFKPSSIVSYYREPDDGYKGECNPDIGACRITDPGPLITDYPHAGILGTGSFQQRYPTTPTNRNRARARWTYYHFLGLDVEKSASRTTDPAALTDTNNPTMHNPNCTVCHRILDPVAGAFQNYDENGLYRSRRGGLDSLDEFYKEDPGRGTDFEITARSFAERQVVSIGVWLGAGTETIRIEPFFDPPRAEESGIWWDPGIERVTVRGINGEVITHVQPERLADELELCGEVRDSDDAGEFFESYFCPNTFLVEIASSGHYDIEVSVWVAGDEAGEQRRMLSVGAGSYAEGDTWYRDMRTPGFDGEEVPRADSSLQWLARQIIADSRFAEATVKFWWPAIMGSEVAEPPEDESGADFEGLLLAANAQGAEVERLADGLRHGFPGSSYAYNLKDLLVEIVLSKWFRSDMATDMAPIQRTALRNAGANRLLTPEELARKTDAVMGVQWGRWTDSAAWVPVFERRHNALTGDYRLMYGGIDSEGITDRARDITTVMTGVAERHAAEMSCPVVLREFFLLPDAKRRLFAGIDPHVTPVSEFDEAIRAKLVELHDKLFGVQVTPDSSDVEAAYRLFVDAWEREREPREGGEWWRWPCNLGIDLYFYEGILDDTVVEYENEEGVRWHELDWDRVNHFLDGINFSDPHHTVQAWVIVLAAMMMDYRYLYL